MKVRIILTIMILSIIGGIFSQATADEEQVPYSGDMFPFFQAMGNGHVFCRKYKNYTHLFKAKIALYDIDLNSRCARKVFAVRNTGSSVFTDGESFYFTYPRSILCTHLTYGPYKWFSAGVDDADKKKNWNFLCEIRSDSEQQVSYFYTIDGVYRKINSREEYGHCEMSKFQEGKYTSAFKAENARLCEGYSFVVIEEADWEERQSLLVYDICGARTIRIPCDKGLSPRIIIHKDRLYYTTDYKVLFHDITTGGMAEIYKSDTDIRMELFYDDQYLYIYEYIKNDFARIHKYSMLNNQYIESDDVPPELGMFGSYIIVDGVLLSGLPSSKEIKALNLNTGESYTIEFQD